MTKQEVSLIMEPTTKNPVFQNYGLGLMTEKERLFLHKHKIVKAVRSMSGEVSDTIIDTVQFEQYYEHRKEIDKDRKYSRKAGLEYLKGP